MFRGKVHAKKHAFAPVPIESYTSDDLLHRPNLTWIGCDEATTGDKTMAGEFLDLSSDPDTTNSSRNTEQNRRFVGVQFACCSVYARVYINKEQTAYVGHCPKCVKRVELKIGPGGTDKRFFTAY